MSFNEDWSDVSRGTFRRLVDELPAETRERSFRPIGSVAVVALMLAALAFGFSQMSNGPGNDGTQQPTTRTTLACHQVVELLPQYHNNELSPAEHEAVKAHLAYCDGCCQQYEDQFGVAVRISGHPTVAALLAAF